MTEIAKNIKKQRLLSGMNIEEFASLAGVDAVTASGWESGRVLPDIEALKNIASVLGTDAESLIYGKKTKPAENAGADRNILMTVLTVMGSLLTVAGLVILFVTLYKKLDKIKDLLSFIPLLIGFACAFFAKTKKNGSAVWNEGSAAVWTAGAIITLALTFGSRNSGLESDAMLLLTMLCVLPVLLIMKAIVPFLTEIYAVTHFAFYLQSSMKTGQALATGIVHIIVLSLFFVYLKKCFPQADVKTKFLKVITVAVAAVSAFIHICIFAYNIDSYLSIEYFVVILLGTVFAAAVNFVGSFRRDFFNFAEAGLAVCVLILSFFIANDNSVEGRTAIFVCLFVFSALVVAGCAVYAYSAGSFGALNCVEALFIPVFAFIVVICCALESTGSTFTALTIVLSLVLGALIIVSGVRTGSLVRTNTGMLTVCTVALFLIAFSDAPPVFKGLSVMAAGIVILVINSRLVRSSRKNAVKEGDENA